MNDKFEKTIERKLLYKGRILNYGLDKVLLPNKQEGIREYVEHPGGVGILAIKDGLVYLVKQFRYPYKKEIIEIPAGKLEKNEDPLVAGKREFLEELGATTNSIIHLGDIYPSVGYTNEIIHIYFSNDFTMGNQHLDEDEFVDLVKIPFLEFEKMIINNEIKDAKTIAAYCYYKAKIK